MVINKSVEEAVVVCLMLAVQSGHIPVDSTALSGAMGVSDSYLKKTLRKLVVSGLVSSSAGKAGGFTLAKKPEEITIADVFKAIEGDAFGFKGSTSAHKVFADCPNLTAAELKTKDLIEKAGHAFLSELEQSPITDLLREGVWINGSRDWRKNRGN